MHRLKLTIFQSKEKLAWSPSTGDIYFCVGNNSGFVTLSEEAGQGMYRRRNYTNDNIGVHSDC